MRHFNPRPPRGGRRITLLADAGHLVFQSTPPARGATSVRLDELQVVDISIHAPREGGDTYQLSSHQVLRHFNPRPPRGGRQHVEIFYDMYTGISIHAPREGGDFCIIAI